MNCKEYVIAFNSALNSADTEIQTYGCRHSNPEICGNNGIVGVCAFCRDDHICKKPSRAWKKHFAFLQEQTQSKINET